MKESEPSSRALTNPNKSSRRTNQVKVTLNQVELDHLDKIVAASGSDRASVFRSLLANISQETALSTKANRNMESHEPERHVSTKPLIYMAEPRSFDEVVTCVDAIRQGNAVTLNLTLLEAVTAQRGVDFVAGGVYALCGTQERLGESIFLFSSELNIKRIELDEEIKAQVAVVNRELGEHSPANPPLLKSTCEESTES